MLKRVCAAVLIVLGISPVTAPFATADLADFLHGHVVPSSAASFQAPVITHRFALDRFEEAFRTAASVRSSSWSRSDTAAITMPAVQ